MPQHYVAWWNLENLFDEENSPRRTDKLRRVLGNDIVGWTPALRNRKLDQLASVIVRMNTGQGPDLLGVCEVENEFVLQELANRLNAQLGRNYQLAHDDTDDERGIDVAFIFDPTHFTFVEMFMFVVMRRTATRELYQVNFTTQAGRKLTAFGNHWPSRSGGKLESAGYRAIAGETLAYFHERVLEVHGSDCPTLAMGDFNDEPFDRSLEDYALSSRSAEKVKNARIGRFLNLMWPLMGVGRATFYFDNWPNFLDQILVNRNLLKDGSPLRVLRDTIEIIEFPDMVDRSGSYPEILRFGGMGKPVNQDGFSDHLPIGVMLEED